jgi:hypothetical protein
MIMDEIKIEPKFCPFINDNYEECYCNDLKSQNIETVIYYCGKNYKLCSIYNHICQKKKIEEKGCENCEQS